MATAAKGKAIKVNGKAVQAKVRVTRNPLFGDEKYTGEEPTWDTARALEMSDEVFENHMRRSLNYYNYYFSQKDAKKYVVLWMKNSEAFAAEQVKAFEKVTDKAVPMTVCGLAMAHKQGMPFREATIAYMVKAITKSINTKVDADDEAEVVAKPKAFVPTIQDRLNEKTAETLGELEGHFDAMLKNAKYEFKVYDFLVTNNVPQSQLGKYEAMFQARFNEWKAAFEKQDEQLVEGYSCYTKADFKRVMAFMDQLLNDVNQYRGVKKAAKAVRAPRSVSKEKVVSKLKYAKEDKPLKLVSVNPADVIGAQELFVYNIRTRKLGRYIADSLLGPLNVKGTSITGYNETKSVAKTLRKPAEQLKEFAKAGKVALRKFVDDIKATETLLNGRINVDTILLKVL